MKCKNSTGENIAHIYPICHQKNAFFSESVVENLYPPNPQVATTKQREPKITAVRLSLAFRKIRIPIIEEDASISIEENPKAFILYSSLLFQDLRGLKGQIDKKS